MKRKEKTSCDETLRIYSLNDFPVQFTAELAAGIMLYILSTSVSYAWKCVPFDQLAPVLPPPYPLSLVIWSPLCECGFFRFHMWDHTVFLFPSQVCLTLQLGTLSLPAASLTLPLSLNWLPQHPCMKLVWHIDIVFCHFSSLISSSFRVPAFVFLSSASPLLRDSPD